ncbi:hypothetical protein F5Y19DRAFT_464478 [Xylariaceae sp. FL1651]|nr:hypothetical protein F5Y19DRAFT_464478 [Xylariaceae sp. FL1651]
MASLLPQYVSPSSQPVDGHDLAELSPRPADALLANERFDSSPNDGGSSASRGSSIHPHNKGNYSRAKASVTIQEPPWSPSRTGDTVHDYRAGKRAYQKREQNLKGPELWHPPLPPEPRGSRVANNGPQLSFFESVFMTRPTYPDRTSSTKVDQSFKLIERRERQMQQELQQLLDAQDYALEKHLADNVSDDSTQRSRTPESETHHGHIVPVRQPKKRHLSKKEARLGISRCMSQLTDLKNEEEAYIAAALAERKAALWRLRNLSTKRNSIVAEMKAIESDREQPLKNEIRKMENQHRTVCEDIEKLERKLRQLKQAKTGLESKIAETKSAMDSELSGYTGALRECDKRIKDIMDYPEISVLEMEGLIAQDADLRALVGQHISGFEFLSLRPERRTLPMAKDWWEGEVQVLEARKAAVDKDRAALDEGTQLWQEMLGRLEAHDQHLKLTFAAISRYTTAQDNSDLSTVGNILKKQYIMCKKTVKELEDLQHYTEAQGWKLLVTALSAEINYFYGLKKQLCDTLYFIGWADGVVTPRPDTSSGASDSHDLLGVHNDGQTGQGKAFEEDLSGSVIRRWDGTDEIRHDSPSDDLLGDNRIHSEDSDNEVPPGLLSEVHHESEDEHVNEIPPEFLSMHSPPSKSKDKGKSIATMQDEDMEAQENAEEEEEEHHALSRESSANDVPSDLLSESHHPLD